ncbi:MAG: OmpA family protein [Prolixibacteraceae bacterium]|nr:OmpA family protein [Prolixibacteraceae bacterium]
MVHKTGGLLIVWVLLGCLLGNSLSAQDNEFRWAIKPHYSLLWYQGELGSQFLNFNQGSNGAGLAFSHYLSPSFDLEISLLYARLNLTGTIDQHEYYSSGNIFSPGLLLQYQFNNGYLLKQDAKLKPYAGFGFNYLIGKTSGTSYELQGQYFSHFIDELAFTPHAGIKYQLGTLLSIFGEAYTMLSTTEELDGAAIDLQNDHFGGLRLGLIIRLGRDKDQDKDGVPDKTDECPDTPPGVEVDEKGCPLDRDLDGIPDYEDDCPDDPGLPQYNGCPDTDGDGFIDKIDDCPELPGLPQYNGCPDSDGDGVIDPKDLCPDTPPGVVVDEYGCPVDSDGDGLTDDVDQCPEEYGPMEYMGCPEPPDVGWPSSDKDSTPEVYFETDQYELDPAAEEELQKMVKYLFENPMMNIRLYGFADPRGSKEYNEILSARRVEAVKKFLLRKGVPENRIMVKALGEIQEVKTTPEEENLNDDQKFKKARKVQFETFFFMR